MRRHLSFPYLTALWVLLFPLVAFLLMVDDYRESEVSARIGWLLLLVAFSYVVRIKWFYLLILLPFVISGIIDLFYSSTFSQQFEAPLFRVLTDTDVQESTEFLSNYLSPFNVGILLIYIAGFIYLGSKAALFAPESFKSKLLVSVGVLMMVVAVQQIWFYERFKDVLPGALGQVVDGYKKYQTLQEESLKRPELLAKYDVPVLKRSDEPQTYIVVIGESASRKHHSLFGYQRKTNPELEAIKNELILFNDVVSPYAVTYLSLSYTLTQKRINNDLEFTQALSSVGLAKKAGFKTWWISTQPKFEGTTFSLSTVADETVYLNDGSLKDAAVFAEVEKALQDKSKHKVIFVHIRGSHMTYEKRYPQNFERFKTQDGLKLYTDSPTGEQVDVSNAYDNSILYTDYVVAEIIDLIKQYSATTITGLTYFADHGEEVYDYKDFIGHELKRVTPVMFEIPFVVWTNKAYQQSFSEQYNAMLDQHNVPFLNDDFFDFGLCFMGIETGLAKEARSPCEINYQPKERWVAGRHYKDGRFEK